MLFLKQSTASQSVLLGPFLDDTDGKTAETGLTIANTDIRISKNGANIAAKNSGGGTHDELGYYTITLDATDTDTVGRLEVMVHVAGALPVWREFQVLEEAVYDISFASAATGAVPVASIAASAITATSIATDAIAATKIASGAITSAKFAAGAIDAAAIATDAITAAKIAADAIGASELAADAASEIGTACWATATRVLTAPTNLTGMGVDVTAISGDSAAADNLELDYDGTGYNKSASTIGTCTTNTDMRGTDSAATAAELAKVPKSDGTTSWNATALASINAEADTAITDAALATAANLATVDTVVDNLNLGIIYGTAQTGTLSTTQCTSDLTAYADDELIGRAIIFTGGTADGQASDITDYANASGLITFSAIATAPVNGDTFKIV